MKHYKLLPIITGLFVTVLIISNVLDVKLFHVFDFGFFGMESFNLPAGVLIFPLGYVFGDMLTEVYGYATSRKVIWTGFISLIMFISFTSLSIMLTPAEGWNMQAEYAMILGHIPRIVLGSIAAYFFGEFTNSYILAKMKVRTKGDGLALRFVVSTVFGQLVDTMVFAIIAFAGVFSIDILISLVITGWLFKVLWEIVALPISIPLVKWLKKYENEDYFDKKTDFNPFHIG